MIRVLVVDDKGLVRKGLQALLCRAPEIECIAEARDGDEAVELAGRLTPDVISMDYAMPRMNGFHATRKIIAVHPEARIVIVAMSTDEHLVKEAFESGAKGYVSKLDMHTEIVPAVRAVHAGRTYLSTHVPHGNTDD